MNNVGGVFFPFLILRKEKEECASPAGTGTGLVITIFQQHEDNWQDESYCAYKKDV